MNIKYWNKNAENYNNVVNKELQENNGAEWARYIFDLIINNYPNKDSEEELKILDIGTGPGFIPTIFKNYTFNIIGIDSSNEMIKKAKENKKKYNLTTKFKVMDAEKTTFKDDTFDIIICRNLVWTLENPEKSYNEWFRILKRKGILIIFDGSWYIHHFDTYEKKRFIKESKDLLNNYGIVAHNYGAVDDIEDYMLMKSLPLSKKKRPEWDVLALKSIGYKEISVEKNYLDKILGESARRNTLDITPVFCITAMK